jgi:hypothetical protein
MQYLAIICFSHLLSVFGGRVQTPERVQPVYRHVNLEEADPGQRS